MRKILLGFALSAMLFALCGSVGAQQPKRNSRIGFLTSSSASAYTKRVEAFRGGLRDLGYVEGQNIAVEYRYAEGKNDRLTELTAELVRLKVDVIVAGGDTSVRAAKKVTEAIPIVTTIVSDPVALGFVASPCEAWRKHHGVYQLSTGARWKTAGAPQGGSSPAFPRGCPRESGQSRIQRTAERDRGRG
jgi:ABC-type uncharacterized transport system substrate-binding protein